MCTFNRSLKWDDYVITMFNKAATRIYFVKQLKCSLVGPDDLCHLWYATVIRPVLEYACPVWHSGLTVEHRSCMYTIQKCVIGTVSDTPVYIDGIESIHLSIVTVIPPITKGVICFLQFFSLCVQQI